MAPAAIAAAPALPMNLRLSSDGDSNRSHGSFSLVQESLLLMDFLSILTSPCSRIRQYRCSALHPGAPAQLAPQEFANATECLGSQNPLRKKVPRILADPNEDEFFAFIRTIDRFPGKVERALRESEVNPIAVEHHRLRTLALLLTLAQVQDYAPRKPVSYQG